MSRISSSDSEDEIELPRVRGAPIFSPEQIIHQRDRPLPPPDTTAIRINGQPFDRTNLRPIIAAPPSTKLGRSRERVTPISVRPVRSRAKSPEPSRSEPPKASGSELSLEAPLTYPSGQQPRKPLPTPPTGRKITLPSSSPAPQATTQQVSGHEARIMSHREAQITTLPSDSLPSHRVAPLLSDPSLRIESLRSGRESHAKVSRERSYEDAGEDSSEGSLSHTEENEASTSNTWTRPEDTLAYLPTESQSVTTLPSTEATSLPTSQSSAEKTIVTVGSAILPALPSIDYDALPLEVQGQYRADWQAKYAKLRTDWPELQIPFPGPEVSLRKLHMDYDVYQQHLTLKYQVDEKVAWYRVYLVASWYFIEALFSWVGFGFTGYPEFQKPYLRQYDPILRKMAEANSQIVVNQTTGQIVSETSPFVSLILSSLTSIIAFMGFSLLSKVIPTETARNIVTTMKDILTGNTSVVPGGAAAGATPATTSTTPSAPGLAGLLNNPVIGSLLSNVGGGNLGTLVSTFLPLLSGVGNSAPNNSPAPAANSNFTPAFAE